MSLDTLRWGSHRDASLSMNLLYKYHGCVKCLGEPKAVWRMCNRWKYFSLLCISGAGGGGGCVESMSWEMGASQARCIITGVFRSSVFCEFLFLASLQNLIPPLLLLLWLYLSQKAFQHLVRGPRLACPTNMRSKIRHMKRELQAECRITWYMVYWCSAYVFVFCIFYTTNTKTNHPFFL